MNESPTDKLIRELREENAKLLEMIKKGNYQITDAPSGASEEGEGNIAIWGGHNKIRKSTLYLLNYILVQWYHKVPIYMQGLCGLCKPFGRIIFSLAYTDLLYLESAQLRKEMEEELARSVSWLLV